MDRVLFYTTPFFIFGALGMYWANRHVDKVTNRQRWLKFLTYIIIVDSVIASIFFERFYLCALLIVAIGLWEAIRVLALAPNRVLQYVGLGLYLVIAAGFLAFAVTFDRFFQLFLYLQIITFDGFGQVVGQLLGKHRLLPQISPSKTVEGLLGGTLFCLLAAVLGRAWVSFALPKALLVGMITALLAFAGDTLASWVKRQCHVKDYSNLLPGQGGFLDRFDSLLMVGMGYIVLFQLHLWS